MARQLTGVLAPITTPFDRATGEVAPIHLRDNVTRLVQDGLEGVVVAGSTGESALLDPDEQRRMVAWVRDVLPDQRWLVAGTGAESTRQAVALSRAAGAEGADAVLVRPPSYYAFRSWCTTSPSTRTSPSRPACYSSSRATPTSWA